MKDTPIRIVIADENRLYRETICSILQTKPNFQVVAEAEDGLATIQAVQKHRPDVVLMDISMQVMNGLDAAWVIRSKFPAVRVILLSMIEADPTSETIRESGACCCLDKGCSPSEIIHAIRTAEI
jgi:two-component system, NarL family, nitrate/nitrite response regulator NarL